MDWSTFLRMIAEGFVAFAVIMFCYQWFRIAKRQQDEKDDAIARGLDRLHDGGHDLR